MHDPRNRWDEESYSDDQGTGLLWRTARNSGLLLAGCLLLAGGLAQVDEPNGTEPEPAVRTDQVPEPAARQAIRTVTASEELIIPAGPNGHFLVGAEVDGVEIRFLIDTGASQVILTAEDAERLGYWPDSLEYSERFQTANGNILGAPIVLPEVRIGDLEIENVRSSVIRGPISTSLLGMSFLSRLESYEVRDQSLVLHW